LQPLENCSQNELKPFGGDLQASLPTCQTLQEGVQSDGFVPGRMKIALGPRPQKAVFILKIPILLIGWLATAVDNGV
jgi:hypothetical protein